MLMCCFQFHLKQSVQHQDSLSITEQQQKEQAAVVCLKVKLVGGFNPIEVKLSNWIISPSRGENQTCLKPPPRPISTLFFSPGESKVPIQRELRCLERD